VSATEGVRCEKVSGVHMMATGCWSCYMHDTNLAVSYAEVEMNKGVVR
jgi:hypothetical protein